MKTIKSLLKAISGSYLEPSDQRRIDAFLFDLKCGFYTLIVLVLLILFLKVSGFFDGHLLK